MMISVILPVFNEIQHKYLRRVLQSISHQCGPCELIVVDGGSSDDTVKQSSAYGKVIHAGISNRAQRMNLGAKEAKGDVLLFHHPVSVLPPNAFEAIRRNLQDPSIAGGGFSHSFDRDHPVLRFASWYSNAVRGRRGIIYLDHCLFVRRGVYDNIGGFPGIDVFEDTVFPAKMRKKGKVVVLPEKIVTSSRRFLKRGIIRHTAMNQLLKAGFLCGVQPKVLNRCYEGRKSFNVS